MFKFPYIWRLSDGLPARHVEPHNSKVFTCFAGGGGSSMGYKLAGYEVIGFNEIDTHQAKCYMKNLSSSYQYVEDIRTLIKRKDLPKALYSLSILDGSPPCTTFSRLGKRERTWGKERQYREGGITQVLDTLPFEFINLATKLHPKIVIMENVEGMLLGTAIKYVANILKMLNNIGYTSVKYIFDSSQMGVPQTRRRLFIFSIRNDIIKSIKTYGLFSEPHLRLNNSDKQITYGKVEEIVKQFDMNIPSATISKEEARLWGMAKPGTPFSKWHPKGHYWSSWRLSKHLPFPTITPTAKFFHYSTLRTAFQYELILGSSFPIDYDFLDQNPSYVMGMSVPPVMIANIALEVKRQWLNNVR